LSGQLVPHTMLRVLCVSSILSDRSCKTCFDHPQFDRLPFQNHSHTTNRFGSYAFRSAASSLNRHSGRTECLHDIAQSQPLYHNTRIQKEFSFDARDFEMCRCSILHVPALTLLAAPGMVCHNVRIASQYKHPLPEHDIRRGNTCRPRVSMLPSEMGERAISFRLL